MSYPINYPTPQGANVQIFNTTGSRYLTTWVKPQGASFVFFTLIGAGGGGGQAVSDGSSGTASGGGGGSGAVTNCMIPAFLIPDNLEIRVPKGETGNGGSANILYQQKDGNGYTLLTANGGIAGGDATSTGGGDASAAGGDGGTASASNYFSAAGFFQSVAGQAGASGVSDLTTSTTTFLQGGAGGATTQPASQYGYSLSDNFTGNQFGYGIMSPILVSVASSRASNTYSTAAASLISKNGFGCGGGGAQTDGTRRYGTRGGDGLVVIVTW